MMSLHDENGVQRVVDGSFEQCSKRVCISAGLPGASLSVWKADERVFKLVNEQWKIRQRLAYFVVSPPELEVQVLELERVLGD